MQINLLTHVDSYMKRPTFDTGCNKSFSKEEGSYDNHVHFQSDGELLNRDSVLSLCVTGIYGNNLGGILCLCPQKPVTVDLMIKSLVKQIELLSSEANLMDMEILISNSLCSC